MRRRNQPESERTVVLHQEEQPPAANSGALGAKVVSESESSPVAASVNPTVDAEPLTPRMSAMGTVDFTDEEPVTLPFREGSTASVSVPWEDASSPCRTDDTPSGSNLGGKEATEFHSLRATIAEEDVPARPAALPFHGAAPHPSPLSWDNEPSLDAGDTLDDAPTPVDAEKPSAQRLGSAPDPSLPTPATPSSSPPRTSNEAPSDGDDLSVVETLDSEQPAHLAQIVAEQRAKRSQGALPFDQVAHPTRRPHYKPSLPEATPFNTAEARNLGGAFIAALANAGVSTKRN